MAHLFSCLFMTLLFFTNIGFAAEELIETVKFKDGSTLPYLLTSENPNPKYVVLLFPGGAGKMGLHLENGTPVFGSKGNFVIRTRRLMVDAEFATVATDSTKIPERLQPILDDLTRRFPAAKIYIMSTSNGTYDTMDLAEYLSEKIAGLIHTSSLERVHSFDARKYKNRQLLVHHKEDDCRYTPFRAAESSHKKFGTELIAMEGGKSVGDFCEPRAHHGFNGIERETIDAIKAWIKKG